MRKKINKKKLIELDQPWRMRFVWFRVSVEWRRCYAGSLRCRPPEERFLAELPHWRCPGEERSGWPVRPRGKQLRADSGGVGSQKEGHLPREIETNLSLKHKTHTHIRTLSGGVSPEKTPRIYFWNIHSEEERGESSISVAKHRQIYTYSQKESKGKKEIEGKLTGRGETWSKTGQLAITLIIPISTGQIPLQKIFSQLISLDNTPRNKQTQRYTYISS